MSKVARTTIGLMIITILSKILGFIKEIILVSIYGAGMTTDAYITAMNIPTVIFSTIGVALATAFIPLYYEVKKDSDEKGALKFANNVFNIVIIVSVFLSIVGFIFAEPLVKIFAINFQGEKLALAVNFTKVLIFGMIFIGLTNITKCWLNIKDNFIIPGMSLIPYNIIIIISIPLSATGNVNILAIGALVAMIVQFLFQYPATKKNGFKYSAYINFNDKYIKKMLTLILPVFIGVGVNQLNTVVDRSLASTLGDGIITVLSSANRLNTFIQAIFISTIVSVIYPKLSKLASDGDEIKFINAIKDSINIVIILIIPISVGAIVLADPVVRIVFQRGKFDAMASALTSSALIAYSIGMLGFALRDIMNKVFYSLKDTKTPMINGGLSMLINIFLNFIFIKFMGHIGLALATSISSIICIILMFGSLRKKIDYFGQDKILKVLIKSTFAACLMGIITNMAYVILSKALGQGFTQDIISLLCSISVGGVVYAILVLLLKVDEAYIILNIINKKIKCK